MEYCQIKDGLLKQGPLRITNKLVGASNAKLLTQAQLKSMGWIPAILVPPIFDKATHKRGVRSVSIGADDVTFTWATVPLSVSDVYENWKRDMKGFSMSREIEEHITKHHAGLTGHAYTQEVYDEKKAKREAMPPKPPEPKL